MIKIRANVIGIETAGFPGQSDEEIDRLLHMVVVGGGPTGIELSWVNEHVSVHCSNLAGVNCMISLLMT